MLSKDEPYNAELYRHAEKAPKNRPFTPGQALAFLRRKGCNILDNEVAERVGHFFWRSFDRQPCC
ncbi:MAG: hypothetical protein FWE59_05020, partial [Oscillospiraceae bacterium]|nr:hypothetical protein [Oscillospiraceae bacterium]